MKTKLIAGAIGVAGIAAAIVFGGMIGDTPAVPGQIATETLVVAPIPTPKVETLLTLAPIEVIPRLDNWNVVIPYPLIAPGPTLVEQRVAFRSEWMSNDAPSKEVSSACSPSDDRPILDFLHESFDTVRREGPWAN